MDTNKNFYDLFAHRNTSQGGWEGCSPTVSGKAIIF